MSSLSLAVFNALIARLGDQGQADISYSENVGLPKDAADFALEAIFVICNSGMKNTVARRIYQRVAAELQTGGSAGAAFGHKGKASAIDAIWRDRAELYLDYLVCNSDEARLAFCEELPWIGPITKFHLAKNFGVDCVKPDVHLARLAATFATTPDDLCGELAKATGYRKRTIDLLLWRGCADGVLDARTGLLMPAEAGMAEESQTGELFQ